MPFTELKNQEENLLVLFFLEGWRSVQGHGQENTPSQKHGEVEWSKLLRCQDDRKNRGQCFKVHPEYSLQNKI